VDATEAHHSRGGKKMNIAGIALLGVVVFLVDVLMNRKRVTRGG
jgi:hypothetical protein